MSGYQKLYDTLIAVQDSRKSGKLYIYGKEKNALRSAIISVAGGEIEDINYLQKPPKLVLSELLALDIHTVVFNPREHPTDYRKSPDTPDMAAILALLEVLLQDQQLENSAPEQPTAVEIQDVVDLKTAAQAVLEKIYGAGISKKIDAIAESYSPIENPTAFLDHCQQLAIAMLGPDQAKHLFRELYTMSRNAQP